MRRLIFAASVLISADVFAFTDQLTTERIINDNKAFIQFMDVAVTNFGEKQKEDFFAVYQDHFNGEVAFLQSEYKRAFHKVYASQKKDVKLFDTVLSDYYLEESKDILDRMAPFVIKSKNSLARLYLSLGYRDRALSGSVKRAADASHPRLYSYKISQYLEAIKLCRRSMRYSFLAVFQAQDVETKKYILAHMFEIERESGNPFYERFGKKQDSEIVAELNRAFDDYDKEYTAAAAEKKKSLEAAGKLDAKRAEYLGELRIERRSRFKDEERVAEYIRNGEFFKAEDIIRKYVEDFNFKVINATFEVLKTSADKEKPDLDIDRMMLHHLDNNSRLSGPSVLEGFYKRSKVVDDIRKKDEKSLNSPEQPKKADEAAVTGSGSDVPAATDDKAAVPQP